MKRIEDMNERELERCRYTIAACLFLLAFWMLLSGCSILKMSETRAAKKIASVEQKQPAVLYNYCAAKFPPFVSDSTHIEYKPGQHITTTDTLTRVDTVYNVIYKYITKNVRSVDTVFRDRIKQVSNGAKEAALTIERDNAKQSAAVLSAKVTSKNKWLWILGAFAAVMVVWKIANWLKWVGV